MNKNIQKIAQKLAYSLLVSSLVLTSLMSPIGSVEVQAADMDYPSVGMVSISQGLGSNISLDHDSSFPVDSWQVNIFNGQCDFGTCSVFDTGKLVGSPPDYIYWSAMDPVDDDIPLPIGDYFVSFSVWYSGEEFAKNTTQEIHITKPSIEYWGDDSPIVSAEELVEGSGGSIHLDYSPLPDQSARVVYFDLTIKHKHLPNHYRYNHTITPGSMLRVDDLPTTLSWNGLNNSDEVMPAGDYQVRVMLVMRTSTFVGQYFGLSWQEVAETPIDAPDELSEDQDESDEGDGNVESEADELTPEELAEQERIAELHPVLLVHGLNSYPNMWRDAANNSDYVSLLKSWGYPENYISTYSYTGTGVGINGYNNQGSIVEVSLGMREAVLKLRQASLSNGGDGEVDIVAHSMGGLVARQYIKLYGNSDYIWKVVTVGTPYLGSWLLRAHQDLDELAESSAIVRDIQVNLRSLLLEKEKLDLRSRAIVDLTPGSKALKLLDYQDINSRYHALYGNINIIPHYSIFNLVLKGEKLDIGDVLVNTNSATYLSTFIKPAKYMYYQYEPIDLNLEWKGGFKYEINYSLFSIYKYKYSHNELLKQADVQARVKYILLN